MMLVLMDVLFVVMIDDMLYDDAPNDDDDYAIRACGCCCRMLPVRL